MRKNSATSMAALERATTSKEVLCPYIVRQVLELKLHGGGRTV